jgi:hypothetical protein
MKLNFKTLSLAFVVMSSIQGSTVAFAAADVHEADHVALRALRDKAATAINKQDIKALASCFAKDFVFTAVNQTVLTNEAQMQDFFDRMFKSSAALVTSLKTGLTAGTVIAPDECTRAFLISPPFSKWKNGTRIAKTDATP